MKPKLEWTDCHEGGIRARCSHVHRGLKIFAEVRWARAWFEKGKLCQHYSYVVYQEGSNIPIIHGYESSILVAKSRVCNRLHNLEFIVIKSSRLSSNESYIGVTWKEAGFDIPRRGISWKSYTNAKHYADILSKFNPVKFVVKAVEKSDGND